MSRYGHSDDPLVAACNSIALIVASSQPFYPLYVRWLVGEGALAACLTFLSTPFFLAVPAISRINPAAGRAMLPLTGMANMALCAKLFGTASGVELFLFPCVTIGLLAFRQRERLLGFAIAGVALFLYAVLHDHYGEPIFTLSPQALNGFSRLNAFSVGTLSALVGLTFGNAFGRTEGKR